MKYAIIDSGGKQYKAIEGADVMVDKLPEGKTDEIIFANVLFIHDNEKYHVGKPYLLNYKVVGKSLGMVKGTKIEVSKFKAKVRYRRHIGFRPKYSKILIERIEEVKSASSKAAKASAKS